MKVKRLFAVILAVIFLLAMVIPTVLSIAYAEPTDTASLSVKGGAKQNADGSYQIDVTVSVSGGEETDAITNLTIYAGDLVVDRAASLSSGSSKTFSRTAAKISDFMATATNFMVYVTYTDFGGSSETYEGSLPITSIENPKFTAKCTVSNTKPAKNEKITLTYVISNTGSVDMTDVTLFDPITNSSDPIKSIGTIPAGTSKTITLTVKVRVSTQSAPYLTYKVGSAQKKYEFDATSIQVQEPKLTVTLTTDLSALTMGEAVTLTGTINNIGTLPVKSIKVMELNLGEIKLDKTSLSANKNFAFTKIIKPVATATYCYIVTCEDEAGNSYTFKSNQVKVTVNTVTPNPEDILSIQVVADQTNFSAAGKVIFAITIANQSQETVKDVVLTESSVGEISRIGDLDGSRTLRYEVDIRNSTTFIFYLTGKTQNGENLQAKTEPLEVQLVLPSPTPELTPEVLSSSAAPMEPLPHDKEDSTNWIRVIFYIILCLIVLFAGGILAIFLYDHRKSKARRSRLGGRGNIHTYSVEQEENAEFEGYRTPPPLKQQRSIEEDPEKTIYKRRS